LGDPHESAAEIEDMAKGMEFGGRFVGGKIENNEVVGGAGIPNFTGMDFNGVFEGTKVRQNRVDLEGKKKGKKLKGKEEGPKLLKDESGSKPFNIPHPKDFNKKKKKK